jgi:hydrogenase expression/formation protein HypE
LPAEKADQALEILRGNPYGTQAARIGTVAESDPEQVLLKTPYGTTRILDMLSGEILPRIC